MKDIQDIFNDLQELKKEQKEIRRERADILSVDADYTVLAEKKNDLREQMKTHELAAENSMGQRWDTYLENKEKIKGLKQMISDVAISQLMDGKSIDVRDEYDTLFEPVYTVTYSKQGTLPL